MAPTKSKCYLRLSEKAKVLEDISKGVGVTHLSRKYGVAKATICKIKQQRSQILQAVCNTFSGPGKRKTLKSAKSPKMEKKLYEWFLKQREKHMPVNGQILKEKAKFFQHKFKETDDFKASDGWLERFRTRYGIRFLKISGEKLSSQPELVEPFKQKLMTKINELELDLSQVYNADETGLYWKLLPEKTYVASTERTAPGRKVEKQRITFLACTNATGSHKVKPLVIGKAKNPRCFRNWICPVHYESSNTAWMTANIFKNWFHKMFVPQVRNL